MVHKTKKKTKKAKKNKTKTKVCIIEQKSESILWLRFNSNI